MNSQTNAIEIATVMGEIEFKCKSNLQDNPLLIWDAKQKKLMCTESTCTFSAKYLGAYMIDTRYEKDFLKYGTVTAECTWFALDYSTYPDDLKTLLLLMGI